MIEPDSFLLENAARLGINPANVNPHSVDLCLGSSIIEMDCTGREKRCELAEGESFTFRPGYFYLCHTQEIVHVPETHRGQLLLKSSTARKGLNHLMAGYVDGGWVGSLTLEFVAYLPVTFKQGQKIVQIEFAQLASVPLKPYGVTGRYQGSAGVEKARPEPV